MPQFDKWNNENKLGMNKYKKQITFIFHPPLFWWLLPHWECNTFSDINQKKPQWKNMKKDQGFFQNLIV